MQLPSGTAALLFDLDGVVTNTAVVHARAWKTAFDEVLAEVAPGAPPFGEQADDDIHIDGRGRLDAVRALLASRGVALPEGDAGDAPGAPTVQGVARRKNDLVGDVLHHDGVEVFDDAVDLLRRTRGRGIATALVSASTHAREVVRIAGLEDQFDAWVDGVRIAREHLPGKPAPDTFLAAARDLGTDAGHAVVLEDALAGVQAGRAGRFSCVVGVDRTGHARALREHGADVAVDDLRELELPA